MSRAPRSNRKEVEPVRETPTALEKRVGDLERELEALRTRRLGAWPTRLLLLLLLAAVAVATGVGVRWRVQAQGGGSSPAPGVLNYQGQLTDAAGTPLTGNYDVTFRLYDVSDGGTALWTEAHTGPNAVAVTSGLFSTLLGSIVPIPGDVMSSSPLYLGITVGSDAEMTPRQPVSSVAYALVANDVADGAITEWKIADAAVTRPKLATVTKVKEMVRIGSVNMNLGDDYHPATSASNNYFFLQIPDDYVSGDIVIKASQRGNGPGGTAVMRFYSYIMRDGARLSLIDEGRNIDFGDADDHNHTRTLGTIPASTFQAGDTIRITIMRLGDEAGDTSPGIIADDGVWVEYLGRS